MHELQRPSDEVKLSDLFEFSKLSFDYNMELNAGCLLISSYDSLEVNYDETFIDEFFKNPSINRNYYFFDFYPAPMESCLWTHYGSAKTAEDACEAVLRVAWDDVSSSKEELYERLRDEISLRILATL